MTTYSVWVRTPTGTRIKLADRFVRLQYTLTANQIGLAKLDLPSSFPLSYIQEDSQLEIWRQVPGAKKYLEGDALWFVRDWDHVLDGQGREYISLLAYSANMVLDTAIVDYASGTSYAKKTDQIDDMMKAIIKENRGALATNSARNISSWLTVEADMAAGPSTTKAFAWRNVLAVLRELAQEADDAGTAVFFDVIYTPGTTALEFRTFTSQRGIDHGSTGAKQVILSPRNGTLSEVRRSYISSNERNAVTVGGRGEATDREIERDTDAIRIALSPFNRRELFVDARNAEEGDTAALQAEAMAALKNNRPREIFSARIRDTEAVKYGREYGFGDRVMAEFRGRAVDCRLDSIGILVERGLETIRAELRADE